MEPKRIIFTLAGPDGRIRFVGFTTRGLKSRLARFKSAANKENPALAERWVRDTGFENITGYVVEEVPHNVNLKKRADAWIETLRRQGFDLVNETPEQRKDRKISEETRRKMSESRKGRKMPDHVKARLIEANTGRKITDEQKAIISRTHKGKVTSEETRRKISEKAMGHKRNLGRIQSEEAKEKMSIAHHKRLHEDAGVNKPECRWCAGEKPRFAA